MLFLGTERFIPDILDEHVETLQTLWPQRQGALFSRELRLASLTALEERIAAHSDGLVLADEAALGPLNEALNSGECSGALTAGYCLSRMDSRDSAALLTSGLLESEGEARAGITKALCYGSIDALTRPIHQAFASGPPPVSVSAAEILAFKGQTSFDPVRLQVLLGSESPDVASAAWRVVAILGKGFAATCQAELGLAIPCPHPSVRREAICAAVWGEQTWIIEKLQTAIKAAPLQLEPLELLAILAKPDDLQRIVYISKHAELGPKRFQILGAYGHPGVVEELFKGMAGSDLRSAVAAAAAFTKITGLDIESDKRVQLPPQDGSQPDEFEKEFLDEAKLPNIELAHAHWTKVKDDYAKGIRWCRGLNLSDGATPEILNRLDMESRWEACLRGKFEGTWNGTPIDLERFPQSLP